MADRERPRTRLDQPKLPRRGVPRPTYSPDAFGRVAELIARFIGTPRFLAIQTLIIIVWIVCNVYPLRQWLGFDPYPFQFMTLVLSLQAAYAAPLILLAQNRQDDRDRINLEEDRQRTRAGKADTEYLAREVASLRIALGEVATRDFIRSEISRLLEEDRENRGALDGSDGSESAGAGAGDEAAGGRVRGRRSSHVDG
jgi:uncharacterized membrane protein